MAQENLSEKQAGAVQEKVSNKPSKGGFQPKGNFLTILLVLGCVGMVGAFALFKLQEPLVNKQIEEIDAQTKNLTGEVKNLNQNGQLEGVKRAEVLDKIEKNEFKWSKILNILEDLNPRAAGSSVADVTFLSYSGSQDGKITINAQTRDASDPPFDLVSKLISSFKQSPYFSDVYVPSISKLTRQDGTTALTFSLNLKYIEPELTTSTANAEASETSTDSNKVKRN